MLKRDEAFSDVAERVQEALAHADHGALQQAITHGQFEDVAAALGLAPEELEGMIAVVRATGRSVEREFGPELQRHAPRGWTSSS